MNESGNCIYMWVLINHKIKFWFFINLHNFCSAKLKHYYSIIDHVTINNFVYFPLYFFFEIIVKNASFFDNVKLYYTHTLFQESWTSTQCVHWGEVVVINGIQ